MFTFADTATQGEKLIRMTCKQRQNSMESMERVYFQPYCASQARI